VEPEQVRDLRPGEHEQVQRARDADGPEDDPLGRVSAQAPLESGEEFLHADLIASRVLEGRPQMDPIARFTELLERARQTPAIAEPTGMTLSTVGADGRPSARIVLLKGVDAEGLVFYTNTRSRKGRELAARPDISLTF